MGVAQAVQLAIGGGDLFADPGAATLCAEPISVLACSSATTPCPALNIISTQIVTAQLTVTGAGVTSVTQSPPSFNIQPSAPVAAVNLTWASGSSGTAVIGISPSVAATAAARCTNVAGTTTYPNCNMTVANTACVAPPHHYEIQGPANGAVCTSHTFTIKAWADAAQSIPYTAGVATGNLTATGNAAAIPNLGAFTIASGSSTVSISPITFPAAGVTKFNTTTTPPLTGVTTCNFGGSASCDFDVGKGGISLDVPDHLADASQTVSMSAVRLPDGALVCAPAFASVSKPVMFNCTYVDPTTGSKPVTVGGTNVNCGTATATSVSLTFGTNGTATTTVRYPDVGKVSLTANYTGATGTAEAGLVMDGSDTFIAAPKDFAVTTSLAVGASNHVAGADFKATVTARNSSGDATPNFGQETVREGATLSFKRCQPSGTGSGAVDGSFTGTLGNFASGVASGTNLNWTEVGNGDVIATLKSGNYLGSALAAATGNTGAGGSVCGSGGTSAGSVGPFRPAYFDTVVMPGCSAAFTYAGVTGKLAGQPFTVKVKAKRLGGDANDTTNTLNYAGATWARAVTLSDAYGGPDGVLVNGSVAATAFVDGVASPSNVSYTFTDKHAPYSLKIRAVDTDTVSSSGHAEGTTAMRSGRLRLSNAYGSVSPIYMPVEAQYWSGQSWIKNTDDSCTSTTGGSPQVIFAAAPASSAGWTLTPAAFGGGQMNAVAPTEPTGLRLDKAPPGATTITATTVPEWLKWTWGGVTTAVAPSANANVGIYGTKESRKAVHVRELY